MMPMMLRFYMPCELHGPWFDYTRNVVSTPIGLVLIHRLLIGPVSCLWYT